MKPLRTLLILLVVLALGAFGTQWLAQQQPDRFGQVMVRVGGYDYLGSLPHAVLLLLIALVLLWLLWKLATLPFRAWMRHRRKQGRARLIDGLTALQAGQWARAEKLLVAAADDDEAGPLARAAAARSADARGDDAVAEAHLQALAAHAPVQAALLRAERALEHGRTEEALTALDAPDVQPLPPRGLLLRARALAAAGRADEAYGMLGPLRQQNALPTARLTELETGWAAASLQQAADGNTLAARWEALPRALRLRPAIVSAYATRAADFHWDDAATHSLEQAINADWNPQLVALYGHLPVNKFDSRRASAQAWLQAKPGDPALLLSLGRLALAQTQWPQAREFLLHAVAAGAGAEAWEALSDGFSAQGDDRAAAIAARNALKAGRSEAVDALPDAASGDGPVASAEERDEHGVPRLRDGH